MGENRLLERYREDRRRFSGLATACRLEAEKRGIDIPRGTELAGFQGSAIYHCGLIGMNLEEADQHFKTNIAPTSAEMSINPIVETREQAEARRGGSVDGRMPEAGKLGGLAVLIGCFAVLWYFLFANMRKG